MNLRTTALLFLVALAGCGQQPLPSDVVVTLDCPEGALTDGVWVVPLDADTRHFRLRVVAEVPRLADNPSAEVLLNVPAESGQEGRTASVVLQRVAPGRFEGVVTLTAPGFEIFDARAEVAGESGSASIRLSGPELAVGGVKRNGWSGASPIHQVCVESTALRGTVDVSLEGARFEDGRTTTQAKLQPGLRCEPSADGLAKSAVALLVTADSQQFTLSVRLQGTTAAAQEVLNSPLKNVIFQFDAVPEGLRTLPAAGEFVTVQVRMTEADIPVAGLLVRLHTLPAAQTLPASISMDARGEATATILVPKDVNALWVEAETGGFRAGFSMTRSP